jgi:WD40 repeat protein
MSSKTKDAVHNVMFQKAGFVKCVGNTSVPYGICWSNDISIQQQDCKPSVYRYLATVAGRYVTILKTKVTTELALPEQGSCSEPFKIVQSYIDPNQDEDLYCCAFAGRCEATPLFLMDESLTEIMPLGHETSTTVGESQACNGYSFIPPAKRNKLNPRQIGDGVDAGSHQLLCIAGKNAFVKVIDTRQQLQLYSLRCLDEIWDLQRSPANEWIIIGASKDTTARIWNLQDGGSLLYILGGRAGHRDAVIAGMSDCAMEYRNGWSCHFL